MNPIQNLLLEIKTLGLHSSGYSMLNAYLPILLNKCFQHCRENTLDKNFSLYLQHQHIQKYLGCLWERLPNHTAMPVSSWFQIIKFQYHWFLCIDPNHHLCGKKSFHYLMKCQSDLKSALIMFLIWAYANLTTPQPLWKVFVLLV